MYIKYLSPLLHQEQTASEVPILRLHTIIKYTRNHGSFASGEKVHQSLVHGVYTIKNRRWLRILHSKTDNKSTLILAHDSSTKYIAKTNLDAQEKAD